MDFSNVYIIGESDLLVGIAFGGALIGSMALAYYTPKIRERFAGRRGR